MGRKRLKTARKSLTQSRGFRRGKPHERRHVKEEVFDNALEETNSP